MNVEKQARVSVVTRFSGNRAVRRSIGQLTTLVITRNPRIVSAVEYGADYWVRWEEKGATCPPAYQTSHTSHVPRVCR